MEVQWYGEAKLGSDAWRVYVGLWEGLIRFAAWQDQVVGVVDCGGDGIVHSGMDVPKGVVFLIVVRGSMFDGEVIT